MSSGSKILIVLVIFLASVCFWFTRCRDSYLLAKARLITISSVIRSYQMDNGELPCLDVANGKIMMNGPVSLPGDPGTGSNKAVGSYDGTGGWVYDRNDRTLKINSTPWWNPYAWGRRLTVKIDL